MNKAKIVNITGLTKSQIDYLCEHDYIKLGEKYYISKERASKIITQVQANGAEQSANTCNLQSVSNNEVAVCPRCASKDVIWTVYCNDCNEAM